MRMILSLVALGLFFRLLGAGLMGPARPDEDEDRVSPTRRQQLREMR